jgi:hypothetical protein
VVNGVVEHFRESVTPDIRNIAGQLWSPAEAGRGHTPGSRAHTPRLKRLLARVDRFKTVILDFQEVTMIGQAFADEIFRVFRNSHPEIDLYPIHANTDVQDVIRRAENTVSG